MEVEFQMESYLKWEFTVLALFYIEILQILCFILQIQIHQKYFVADQAESFNKHKHEKRINTHTKPTVISQLHFFLWTLDLCHILHKRKQSFCRDSSEIVNLTLKSFLFGRQ